MPPFVIRMDPITLAHPEVVEADHTTIKICQQQKIQKLERVVEDAAVGNIGKTVDLPHTS